MKSIILSICGILLIGSAQQCSNSKKTASFDYGKVKNGVYTNKFFRCTMTLPENWVVQSKEQMEQLAQAGKDLVAGDDQNLKALLKASEVRTANLLAAFEHEVGAPVNYNPNLMVTTENMMHSPGVKNGSDYLFLAKRFLKQSQFQYDYMSEEFEHEVINGRDFYKMETRLNYAGIEIKQTFYSTIVKRFSFNLIISYVNEEQKQTLLRAVNSLKFK
ncbi:MAG: hypothetical protein AAGI38_11945 [Bacteroidota bacterium]